VRVLKWILLAVVALFVVLLLVTLMDRGVTFTLACEDSGVLAAGDPLVLQDEQIGRVLLVVPRGAGMDEAIVRIATRHRARAHHGLRFRLAPEQEKEGLFVEIREMEAGSDRPILTGEVLSLEPLSGWPHSEARP
jgi:hypothetical protein